VPSLAVVIPTLGRDGTLGRVLDLLAASASEVSQLEVVLAADARVDDTDPLRELVEGRPWPAILAHGERPGASSARNAGWTATGADLVLFLGDDILPRPGLLAAHLAWHERECEDEVGVLGHVDWARELGRTAFMAWLDHGIQFDYPSIVGTEAGWGRFNTANASVKRALLERVNGFDEGLPFLYEDMDLARRMHGHGFRLLYHRGAVAEHLHEPTIAGWQRRMEMIGMAERAFVARHPEVRPYFHERFAAAMAGAPARGHSARLIRWLPRSFPMLGERAWTSADLYYGQALAPAFFAGWRAARP
jgi:GT2 family glycosyltransferase